MFMLLDSCGLWVTCGAKWGSKRAKRGCVSHLMGALLRVCATWAAEIAGRVGVAFELILALPPGEVLRGLNDGVSSLCGLIGARLPDYL